MDAGKYCSSMVMPPGRTTRGRWLGTGAVRRSVSSMQAYRYVQEFNVAPLTISAGELKVEL